MGGNWSINNLFLEYNLMRLDGMNMSFLFLSPYKRTTSLFGWLLLIGLLTSCQPDTDNPQTGDKDDEKLNAFASQMLDAVNEIRSSGCNCGNTWYEAVPELSWNDALEEAALRHSSDMATNDHFDHTGTDGSTLASRLEDAGYLYQTAGENIARGYPGIDAVVDGWKNSPGHCQNMMNPDFTEMGAAEVDAFWTQDFGKPRN